MLNQTNTTPTTTSKPASTHTHRHTPPPPLLLKQGEISRLSSKDIRDRNEAYYTHYYNNLIKDKFYDCLICCNSLKYIKDDGELTFYKCAKCSKTNFLDKLVCGDCIDTQADINNRCSICRTPFLYHYHTDTFKPKGYTQPITQLTITDRKIKDFHRNYRIYGDMRARDREIFSNDIINNRVYRSLYNLTFLQRRYTGDQIREHTLQRILRKLIFERSVSYCVSNEFFEWWIYFIIAVNQSRQVNNHPNPGHKFKLSLETYTTFKSEMITTTHHEPPRTTARITFKTGYKGKRFHFQLTTQVNREYKILWKSKFSRLLNGHTDNILKVYPPWTIVEPKQKFEFIYDYDFIVNMSNGTIRRFRGDHPRPYQDLNYFFKRNPNLYTLTTHEFLDIETYFVYNRIEDYTNRQKAFYSNPFHLYKYKIKAIQKLRKHLRRTQ